MSGLSPFVSIDAKKASEIFEIDRPSFHYTVAGERKNLTEDNADCSIIIFSEKNPDWNPSFHDLSLIWKIKAKEQTKLFKGPHACAAPGTVLGIALQWYSKSSRQRGTQNVGFLSSALTCQEFEATLSIPKTTLRENVSFVLVLYVNSIRQDHINYPHFASDIGTIIGEISDVFTVVLDGNGSEFNVYTEHAPNSPLWRLEYNLNDPESDLVADTVNVYFNTADKKAYEMIQPDSSKFNKYLQKEIYANILIELIERIRERDPNFNCIHSPEEGSVAQLIKYQKEVNGIDLNDVSSVFRSVREFMYKDK